MASSVESTSAACGLGCRVQGSGFRVQGAGFRVQGSGFRVQGSGRRVQDAGCRVQGAGCMIMVSSVESTSAACGVVGLRLNGYRGTSLMRAPPPLGPYGSPVPRNLW